MKQPHRSHPLRWAGLALALLTFSAIGCLSPVATTEIPAPPPPATRVEAQPTAPTTLPAAIEPDAEEALLIDLYNRVNPSVVHIRVFSGDFILGSGSGFLVDNENHIVTNNHVVREADGMEIVFWDGTRVRGRVIGSDLDADLAVLEVDMVPEGVMPLELGDSDNVQVGQRVIAIGNPFGFQGTMTVGIVSGVGRRLDSQREQNLSGGNYTNPDVIQTDAAINPGNSGGPLFDSAGRVLGVNTAIHSSSGTNSGVGFAAPVNTIKKLLPSLIRSGHYTYPWIGISGMEEIDLFAMEELDLPQSRGVYVTTVTPGGPADEAGLRAADQATGKGGDLITAIDSRSLVDFGDLVSYLVAHTDPGQTVELTIIRDGRTIQLPLVLGERP